MPKVKDINENLKFEEAIHFAVNAHSRQVRKGTDIPYITHPLEVMQILLKMDSDVNLMIAGLLHDVLEDTELVEDDILDNFGEDVLKLVVGHSEDKSKTWKERKQTEVDEASNGDMRTRKLILADKLSNMRSIKKDYDALGDKLWERFNAGADKQKWYYGEMIKALDELKDYKETAECYEELQRNYNKVFGE